MEDHLYLAHHGIKGMKWGVRRFQNKDGSLTAAGRDRYLVNQKMVTLNDGSKVMPAGYKFNRVGQESLDFSKAGGLYVSDASSYDVHRYVQQLGPNFFGKLLNNASYYIKGIEAVKPIKMCSTKQCDKMTLDVLSKSDALWDMWHDSIYTFAFTDDELPSSREEVKKIDPTSDLGRRISASVSASFGNSSCSDTTALCYQYFREQGYDAVPDMFDRHYNVSETPMIIINEDCVRQVSNEYITSKTMRQGKRIVRQLGKVKVDDIP